MTTTTLRVGPHSTRDELQAGITALVAKRDAIEVRGFDTAKVRDGLTEAIDEALGWWLDAPA